MSSNDDKDAALAATRPQGGATQPSADSNPPSSGPLPSKIGRFEITSKLGAGGMGIVMLATDPLLGRNVAIKVLHDNRSRDEATRRLLREAQAMAQLTHENVIVVHEVGEHEGQVYVAMEYVLGTTLARWQVGRTWREIVEMYMRAGRGLQAAHDAGLVHRDFKPDNVLVADDGRVRVTDFGLVASGGGQPSRAADAINALAITLTQSGALMGTPRYMAPEQHLGEDVDARADQFSFCVALYEALCAQPPFAGKTYEELATSVIDGKMRPIPETVNVPSTIRDALRRGLSRERDDRFTSMRELLAALATTSPPTRRGVRRWWPMVGVLAAAGVGVAAWSSRSKHSQKVAVAPDAASIAAQPPEADAAKMDRLRIAFDNASAALAKKDYDAAAEWYERAYGIAEMPQFLFDAAVAYSRKADMTGDPATYSKAVQLYKQYLAEEHETYDRAALEKTIASLESRIASGAGSNSTSETSGLGNSAVHGLVVIQSEPQGATIHVDAKQTPLGVTPWSGWLEGQHTIHLEKPGYVTSNTTVVIPAEKLYVMQVPLVAAKN